MERLTRLPLKKSSLIRFEESNIELFGEAAHDNTAGEGVAVRDKTAGESEAIRDKTAEEGKAILEATERVDEEVEGPRIESRPR